MPEGDDLTREQEGVEKIMLALYFLGCAAMTAVAAFSGWQMMPAVLADAGCAVGILQFRARVRTYSFRSYAVACMMQMSAVLWSVCSDSLALTLPVLSALSLLFVFYCIPETIYVTVASTAFLVIYHFLIRRTVDFSSREEALEAVVGTASVFFVEYLTYVINQKRLDDFERQMRAIVSLKAAERGKDDFMANVSHEIRTPINTICGVSEIMLRGDIPEGMREDVFSIMTAGRSLQSIVSDVLDFTEMQSGKMALAEEAYNITSTVNDVINMSMARKNEKEIDLIVDCDARMPSGLIGDEQKIRRVIMNLVGNALKFTEEGCVTISIGFRRTDYGINLIARVKDTGIGMKKESLEKLFTSFNQVDAKRNRQKEGIGLGLAISQELVDLMGGFITVSSEFGKGSEFQFVVPQKVADDSPVASVRDKDAVCAGVYVDMERVGGPEVRDAYGTLIGHMASQLGVSCHVCADLSELKRRDEREGFTHVFIGAAEYGEDPEYFAALAGRATVAAILERGDGPMVDCAGITRLYKPLSVFPVAMLLNGEEIAQGVGADYGRHGRFSSPEASALVVDDNLMNIRVMEGLLAPYKISVAVATSGAEALEKIGDRGYDIVFLDHMMPEMDGIETLHRIREKKGSYFKKVPIVAVTANAVGGMREVFLKEGFQDFIAKPVEVSVLERVLRRVLPPEKIVEEQESAALAREDAAPGAHGDAAFGGAADGKHMDALGAHGDAASGGARQTDLPEDTFDEEAGARYCGTMADYLDVLRLVGSEGEGEREKIQGYYKARDWKNYATLVHGLKSTMRSVGVAGLSEMARELELAAKHGEEDVIFSRHEPMMGEYARVLGLIEKSRSVHPEAGGASDGAREGGSALVGAGTDSGASGGETDGASDRAREGGAGGEADGADLGSGGLAVLARKMEDAALSFDGDRMRELAERASRCSLYGEPLLGKMAPVLKKIEMSDYLSAAEDVRRMAEEEVAH